MFYLKKIVLFSKMKMKEDRQTNQVPLKKRKKNQNAPMFKYSSKENFENMFHYLFFFHHLGFAILFQVLKMQLNRKYASKSILAFIKSWQQTEEGS